MENKYYCRTCGKELKKNNALLMPDKQPHQLCLSCEQKKSLEYEKKFGKSLALFYCCICFDVPFDLTAVPDKNANNRWIAYVSNLKQKGLDKIDGEIKGFLDGQTAITQIFGTNIEKGEFQKVLKYETEVKSRLPGTAKQREEWGYQEEKPYTTEDYKELDRCFKVFTARLESAGGYDVQQEHILRLCSRMTLDMNKALAKGDTQSAQRLNKMIQENLAAENLRKKDEKPIEDVRIDGIVDAFEKAGLMKEGKILSLPDVQKQLLRRLGALGGRPSHKYPYTLDAADQMIRIIINTMRKNDNLPEIYEFDESIMLDENVSAEFAAEPSKEEFAAYRELGLVRNEKPTTEKQDEES